MYSPSYTDENGNIHCDNPNTITTGYTCRKCGHNFTVESGGLKQKEQNYLTPKHGIGDPIPDYTIDAAGKAKYDPKIDFGLEIDTVAQKIAITKKTGKFVRVQEYSYGDGRGY
ncbi:MAG: hypothetical protein PHE59_05075, partial [Patescibacteria group bacterium]|nr:hypothetical protein [Patescibacteria group bacterium]